MIGDDTEADGAGAKKVGLEGVQVYSLNDRRPVHEVGEILEILLHRLGELVGLKEALPPVARPCELAPRLVLAPPEIREVAVQLLLGDASTGGRFYPLSMGLLRRSGVGLGREGRRTPLAADPADQESSEARQETAA